MIATSQLDKSKEGYKLSDDLRKERLKDIYALLKNGARIEELILVQINDQRFCRKILPQKLGVIFDYDDTITKEGKHNRTWITLLDTLESINNKAAADEIESIRQYYRSIEQERGPLTKDEMHTWHKENLRIYIYHGLRLQDVELQVIKTVEIYPEAAKVLKCLLDRGAAVCIVSAGIKNVIELTLKKYGVDPKKYPNLSISAIELIFNERGALIGYDPDTIVTAEDKSPIARKFMDKHYIFDGNVIAIGDGLTDYHMIDAFNGASMILFVPVHKIGEMTEEKFLKLPATIHAVAKIDFGIITGCLERMLS